jgi:polyhydroxyalkanoate synthesis regulator phasin
MQEEHQGKFGAWLRQAWHALIEMADAMDRSPVEELFERIERLEREVAHRKTDDRAGLAAIADVADVARAQSRAPICR